MNQKKGYGAKLGIALMVVALAAMVVLSSGAFAQTGVGVERQVLTTRLIVQPSSSMYPGIIVDHSGSSDLLNMGVDGASAFRVENSGQLSLADSLNITGDADVDTMPVMLDLDAGVEYHDGGAMVLVRYYVPIDGHLPVDYAQPFWTLATDVPEAITHWAY